MITSIKITNFAAAKYSEKDIIKTFKQVDTDDFETNECVWWNGTKRTGGYGQLYAAGQMHGAHRVIYEMLIGEIPEGLFLLHQCNTPSCVNPKHLRPGTAQENMIDRETSERQFHKLSTNKVKEIKQLLFEGVSQITIAKTFEIHPSMVSQIALGKTHKNIQIGNPQDFIYTVSNYNRLTNELIIEVKKQLYAGVRQATIAKKFGINSKSVSQISTGRYHKNIQIAD